MPAFTLNPTAPGALSEWALSGCAAAWQCLSDTTDANQITLAINQTDKRTYVEFADLPSEAESITGSVNHIARVSEGAGGDTQSAGFRSSGGTLSELTITIPTTGTYYDITTAFTQAPGSVPWTPANLNSAQVGIRGTTGGTAGCQCTKIQVTGVYEVAAGGFAFLIGSLVGAMLGANLMMSHMPMIAGAVAQVHRPGEMFTIIQPHEFPRALAELKAHPYRRYFL